MSAFANLVASLGALVGSRRAAKGQGLVEYALIIALVAVVVIAALLVLGPTIASIFMKINTDL